MNRQKPKTIQEFIDLYFNFPLIKNSFHCVSAAFITETERWLQLITIATGIKIAIWLFSLCLISLFFGFGFVYVCISILCMLFYRRSSFTKRKANEMSAYSVFNENNEKLAGTFDASYFENMLRSKKQTPMNNTYSGHNRNRNRNRNTTSYNESNPRPNTKADKSAVNSKSKSKSKRKTKQQQKQSRKRKHPKRMNKNANQACFCGSGKKYKKCCMKLKQEQQRRKIREQIDAETIYLSSDSSGIS